MLTYLTSKGLSEAQIQLISGHKTKKSLEVYQHLSDPALMLLMSPLTAGRFHTQNGREIEFTAEEVKDAGRHAVAPPRNDPESGHRPVSDS